MRAKIAIIVVAFLIGAYPTQADIVWTSGRHVILDGDNYFEIWMYNDATAAMLGGEVGKLEAFDTTYFNMLDGEMSRLYVHDDSIANIFGGELYTLAATHNSLLYIYAYDVTYDQIGGGYGHGWLEGKYYSDDSTFGFSLLFQDTYSHINIVPEPATLVLISLGGFLLRKKR